MAPRRPSILSELFPRLTRFFGLNRNTGLLLLAILLIGTGEEMWMRFVPKYLQALGAGAVLIGLYDGLKTLIGGVYAYPGGVASDRLGHRFAFLLFTGV
ncbi:MAG: MFS transporter, partial [Verrucomicrobiae bacterium]|nr:MFS transporter [Verrucomicrobiae bacterium]